MRRTWLGLLAGLAIACGGSTSNDGSAGAAGSGGSGGATTGGSSGTGGTVVTGGSGGATGGTSGTGGASSYTSCSQPGSCTLVPTNCCGYCSYSPISGYQAVNKAYEKDALAGYCADPVACPDCVTYDDANHLALCREGQCNAVDLRSDTLSICTADTDCRLRWGTGCCESCGGTPDDIVSYNKNANLEAEVCEPNGGACPPCAPPEYPKYILAYCAQGHCKTTIVGP